MIDAIYLKTPQRIEALGIVYVMALLHYGMLEYRVREQMKTEDTPLVLKGKRKLFEPTGKALLEQLEDITIIRLCGYELDIYVSKKEKYNR